MFCLLFVFFLFYTAGGAPAPPTDSVVYPNDDFTGGIKHKANPSEKINPMIMNAILAPPEEETSAETEELILETSLPIPAPKEKKGIKYKLMKKHFLFLSVCLFLICLPAAIRAMTKIAIKMTGK